MPYYNVDPELYEEYADEMPEGVQIPPEGEFYQPAETTIDFDKANVLVRATRDALLDQGFWFVECHYDGGYDEGFAYFDAAVIELDSDEMPELVDAGRELGVALEPKRVAGEELIATLQASRLAEAHLESIAQSNAPEAAKEALRQRMLSMPAAQRIARALEEFADELASELLGRGFGTGEYTLRGRFRASLRTGRITDVEESS